MLRRPYARRARLLHIQHLDLLVGRRQHAVCQRVGHLRSVRFARSQGCKAFIVSLVACMQHAFTMPMSIWTTKLCVGNTDTSFGMKRRLACVR